MSTKDKGQIGENIACEYLKKNKYIIIERNFKTNVGEIDIICADNGCLVFVEVKLRYDDVHGRASQAVNSHKQLKISQVASQYISKHKKYNSQIRFDVLEVYVVDKSVNHIKNAFDSYLRY